MNIKTPDRNCCDLHVHSTYSDGENTPEELVEMAEKLNLSAIALCDHNTVKGIERFIYAATHKKVDAIPGIEITADYNGKEIHILGLFIKPCYLDTVERFVSKISCYKEESNLNLSEKLNEAGIRVSYSEIKSNAEGGFVNRVHFAKALMKMEYVESVAEAFEKYLDEGKGFYTPAKRLNGFEVVEFLASIKALPVLAHPLISLTYEDLLQFLPRAKQYGLIALETNYSLYDDLQTKTALMLAKKFDLLASGGSDFHGKNKPDISMGIGKGNLIVPAEYYEIMKKIVL